METSSASCASGSPCRSHSVVTAAVAMALCGAFLVACDRDISEAARDGDLDRVCTLIGKGVNVNDRSDGETALHFAARAGHLKVMEYLLAHGADVREKGTGCGTPLQWAAVAGQIEAARLLIDHGADVNGPGTNEATPLHAAVSNGQTEMTKFLLSRGANVNAKMDHDRTPLHLAASGNRIECARVLLSYRADVTARSNGRTPAEDAASDAMRNEMESAARR